MGGVLVEDKLAEQFMAVVVSRLQDLSLRIIWRVMHDLMIQVESDQLQRPLEFGASLHEVYFSRDRFADQLASMIRSSVSRYKVRG